jgi:hypothetical protein
MEYVVLDADNIRYILIVFYQRWALPIKFRCFDSGKGKNIGLTAIRLGLSLSDF